MTREDRTLHATMPAEPSENPRRPQTILVVEDEVLVRLNTADELRQAGFVVLEAVNADEAMVVLRGPEAVDLLFTDVRMPGTADGLVLAAIARALRPDLKIVVASGNAPAGAAAAPVDEFFAKPYDVRVVIGCVKQLLGVAP